MIWGIMIAAVYLGFSAAAGYLSAIADFGRTSPREVDQFPRFLAITLGPLGFLVALGFVAAEAGERRRELIVAEHRQKLLALQAVERELGS
jgi:hypothetical protein